MRTFQRLCAGCVLMLALALPAYAGQIPCGVAAPDPTPQATNATPPATGDEAGGVESVLNVVLGVLALL